MLDELKKCSWPQALAEFYLAKRLASMAIILFAWNPLIQLVMPSLFIQDISKLEVILEILRFDRTHIEF